VDVLSIECETCRGILASAPAPQEEREHSFDMCGCSILVDGPQRVYCTRPKGHEGNHIAAVGPYTPETPVLAEWPPIAP
jgi:hypothetical protein